MVICGESTPLNSSKRVHRKLFKIITYCMYYLHIIQFESPNYIYWLFDVDIDFMFYFYSKGRWVSLVRQVCVVQWKTGHLYTEGDVLHYKHSVGERSGNLLHTRKILHRFPDIAVLIQQLKLSCVRKIESRQKERKKEGRQREAGTQMSDEWTEPREKRRPRNDLLVCVWAGVSACQRRVILDLSSPLVTFICRHPFFPNSMETP